MKMYAYYLPELNLMAESSSNKREVFVVFIHSIGDYVPFDAILLGEV
jgi:hypothetical protein